MIKGKKLLWENKSNIIGLIPSVLYAPHPQPSWVFSASVLLPWKAALWWDWTFNSIVGAGRIGFLGGVWKAPRIAGKMVHMLVHEYFLRQKIFKRVAVPTELRALREKLLGVEGGSRWLGAFPLPTTYACFLTVPSPLWPLLSSIPCPVHAFHLALCVPLGAVDARGPGSAGDHESSCFKNTQDWWPFSVYLAACWMCGCCPRAWQLRMGLLVRQTASLSQADPQLRG